MAKKKQTTIEDESFDQFLRRKYGEDIITTADKVVERKRDILKTTLSLDIALSGGIPDGSTCLISGKPSAGKTTLCLHILKNAIDLGRPVFYIDVERRCKPALLKKIEGLDISKLQIVKSSEQFLSAEEWLDIVERLIKDNKKAVIVVDSVAAMSTFIEQNEEIGANKDMAGVPKLLASFFRRTQQTIDNNDVILLFISQVISNREPRGKKWIEKGGIAVQYASSVWMNATWVKVWDENKKKNKPDGQDIVFKIIKSALGQPYLPCSIPLRYGKGIDVVRDIATNAENLGFVVKAGAWYSIPMFSEEKYQGLENLYEFLSANADKLETLKQSIEEIVLPDED